MSKKNWKDIKKSNKQLKKLAEQQMRKLDVIISKGKIKKRKTKSSLPKIPQKYHLYIKSKFWKNRRNKYFKDFEKKCFICNSIKYIQVHHLEYDNKLFGIEKDEMLVSLCLDCHEQFHLIYGTKRKMYEEFNEFIDLKSAELLSWI